ncbi:MAG: FadR family transcriptional regulator [Bryobacterales bacterium]|nr:FadR family transcriptional regulator [Bryobacterales bacterium]
MRLSEKTVDAIEKMIFAEFPNAGLLLPPELELATRFGVSRIVIREAMKILEDRGLVEVRAGRGTHTTGPTTDRVKKSLLRLFRDQPAPTLLEMEQLLEMRETLEVEAAALASRRATPEDIAEMEEALAQMEAHVGSERIAEWDLRFHVLVAKASHNPYFEMVLEPLIRVMLRQIELTDSYEPGIALHRAIARAIARHNEPAARRAVRVLTHATHRDVQKALAILAQANV